MDSPDRPTVFVSYSRQDKAWKERLVQQLRVLEVEQELEVWDDSQIGAGDDWQPKIEAAMAKARVALLLISADFLTSRFIRGTEVPELLRRRQSDGLRVIPVIVRPCPWRAVSWLSTIQCWPEDGRPLSAGTEHQIETDLAALAFEIRNLLGSSPGRQGEPAPTPRGRDGEGALPLVVASMTAKEAEDLFTGDAFADHPAHWKSSFDLLLEALERSLDVFGPAPGTDVKKAVLSRYGERREDWRPFSSDQTTLRHFVEKLVGRLNDARRKPVQKAEPDILLEFHSDALFAAQPEVRADTADRLGQRGCLLVMDPLALFHPQIVECLNSSYLLGNDAVTVICTGPLDLSASGAAAAVKNQLLARLGPLLKRFDRFEPQWVMRVDDPSSLHLWLKTQLTIAASRLNGSLPVEATLYTFKEDAKKDANVTERGIGSLIAGSI